MGSIREASSAEHDPLEAFLPEPVAVTGRPKGFLPEPVAAPAGLKAFRAEPITVPARLKAFLPEPVAVPAILKRSDTRLIVVGLGIYAILIIFVSCL